MRNVAAQSDRIVATPFGAEGKIVWCNGEGDFLVVCATAYGLCDGVGILVNPCLFATLYCRWDVPNDCADLYRLESYESYFSLRPVAATHNCMENNALKFGYGVFVLGKK